MVGGVWPGLADAAERAGQLARPCKHHNQMRQAGCWDGHKGTVVAAHCRRGLCLGGRYSQRDRLTSKQATQCRSAGTGHASGWRRAAAASCAAAVALAWAPPPCCLGRQQCQVSDGRLPQLKQAQARHAQQRVHMLSRRGRGLGLVDSSGDGAQLQAGEFICGGQPGDKRLWKRSSSQPSAPPALQVHRGGRDTVTTLTGMNEAIQA